MGDPGHARAERRDGVGEHVICIEPGVDREAGIEFGVDAPSGVGHVMLRVILGGWVILRG